MRFPAVAMCALPRSLLLSLALAAAAARCPPPPGVACSAAPREVAAPPPPASQGSHLWRDGPAACACPLTPLAKCCPRGSALQGKNCTNDSSEFHPVVGDTPLVHYRPVEMAWCPFVELNGSYLAGLTADGRLELAGGWAPAVAAGRFCLEAQLEGGRRPVARVCADHFSAPPVEARFVAFAAVSLACVPFLLATAAVHALLPPLRTLHGAIVCCYSLSRLLSHLCTSSVQLTTHNDTECAALAFLMYFSTLASDFWLNVMCFDIFWTFSGFLSFSQRATERKHKKLVAYSVYSWGLPLLLLSVALALQYHPNLPQGLLRPQFGDMRCWFPNDIMVSLAYYYGPVVVLFVCNVVLLILTAIRTAQVKRDISTMMGSESRRHYDKSTERFDMYLKIFVFMSVAWLLEIVSVCVDGPEYLWYAVDVCNTLQGVFVFFIYVWKDRVRSMLLEKLRPDWALWKSSKSTVESYPTGASPSPPGIKTDSGDKGNSSSGGDTSAERRV